MSLYLIKLICICLVCIYNLILFQMINIIISFKNLSNNCDTLTFKPINFLKCLLTLKEKVEPRNAQIRRRSSIVHERLIVDATKLLTFIYSQMIFSRHLLLINIEQPFNFFPSLISVDIICEGVSKILIFSFLEKNRSRRPKEKSVNWTYILV